MLLLLLTATTHVLLDVHLIMYQPPRYKATHASARASQSIAQIFLNKQVLVKISDGRYFQGQFICVDHQCNTILQGAHSYSDLSGRGKRWFGMVMIPGKHLVDISVKAAWPSNAHEQPTPSSSQATSSLYI